MLSLVKINLGFTSDFKDEDIDMLLEHYVDSAKAYLYEATGKEFDEKNQTHKNIIVLLSTHFYENRNVAITSELDRTLTSLFLQAGLQKVDKDE